LNTTVKSVFTENHSETSPQPPQAGVIKDFCGTNANILPTQLKKLKKVIKDQLEDWQLPYEDKTIDQMANAIVNETNNLDGTTGTYSGSSFITQNEDLNWTIACGQFQISTNSIGLVYAFTAGIFLP
jgi:hypothetical protein